MSKVRLICKPGLGGNLRQRLVTVEHEVHGHVQTAEDEPLVKRKTDALTEGTSEGCLVESTGPRSLRDRQTRRQPALHYGQQRVGFPRAQRPTGRPRSRLWRCRGRGETREESIKEPPIGRPARAERMMHRFADGQPQLGERSVTESCVWASQARRDACSLGRTEQVGVRHMNGEHVARFGQHQFDVAAQIKHEHCAWMKRRCPELEIVHAKRQAQLTTQLEQDQECIGSVKADVLARTGSDCGLDGRNHPVAAFVPKGRRSALPEAARELVTEIHDRVCSGVAESREPGATPAATDALL